MADENPYSTASEIGLFGWLLITLERCESRSLDDPNDRIAVAEELMRTLKVLGFVDGE